MVIIIYDSFRGISWILGARWMYYYLLDGDIASNFLSWQWVAGTLNGKPYLFNKNNIEKYSKYKSIKSSILNQDYDYLIYHAKKKLKYRKQRTKLISKI